MLHPAAARHNTNSEMMVTKQTAGVCGADSDLCWFPYHLLKNKTVQRNDFAYLTVPVILVSC